MFKVFSKKQKQSEPEEEVSVAETSEVSSEASVSVAKEENNTEAVSAVNAAESRDLFMSLLAGLYDGILIVDSKGYLIRSNKRAAELFGYSDADLWNINCSELIPQLNVQVLYKLRAYIAEKRYTVVNATCKRHDESAFPAEIAISSILMNNDINMVLSVRNCERRNKALHRNKLKVDALKYAGAGIVLCQSDGKIEYANPAFVRMIAVDNKDDLLEHSMGDFCQNKEQLEQLIESPSAAASWYGIVELTTVRGVQLKVQATASLAGDNDVKNKKPNLVITMTLIPAAAVSIS
jgi:PAS domain S-box-containing protein